MLKVGKQFRYFLCDLRPCYLEVVDQGFRGRGDLGADSPHHRRVGWASVDLLGHEKRVRSSQLKVSKGTRQAPEPRRSLVVIVKQQQMTNVIQGDRPFEPFVALRNQRG